MDFLKTADVAKESSVNTRICLVIDEEVFAWLRDAPILDSQVESSSLTIKIIDGAVDHDHPDESTSQFHGKNGRTLRITGLQSGF